MRTPLAWPKALIVPCCLAVLICGGVYSQDRGGAKAPSSSEKKRDIVETASATGLLETFVKAVRLAGLTDPLKKRGPFTVFAPSDKAFRKLTPGTLEGWFQDPAYLSKLLKYHVVPGRVPVADIDRVDSFQTWLGRRLPIESAQDPTVDGAGIVKGDIECRNGLIHVIDAVLLPRENLAETARKAGSFTTLLKAAEAADLLDLFKEKGPFTLFAPTDDAFRKLPAETVKTLFGDPERLKSALEHHLVRGRLLSKDLKRMITVETVQGESLRIEDSGGVKVNGARLIMADIKAANGVIHGVDTVLLD